MKGAFVFVSVAVAVCAVISFDPEELHEHWTNFKKTFRKSYTGRDEEARRQIFQDKLSKIANHNLKHDLGHSTYRQGINEFSDMSQEEFVSTMMGLRTDNSSIYSSAHFLNDPSYADVPETIDWRDEGYVTPVQNQYPCGCCWAFSAVGALEGQHKKKTGDLVWLSKQQLVDCVYPSDGCTGGAVEKAFDYIRDNKGIVSEESYPYTAADKDPCKFEVENVAATCTDYNRIPSGDPEALKTAVGTIGPITAFVSGVDDGFYNYKSGIYTEPDCDKASLDHGVLIVGYEKDYWIVKNSWGTSWGMDGYINIAMHENNKCGLANHCTYPVV